MLGVSAMETYLVARISLKVMCSTSNINAKLIKRCKMCPTINDSAEESTTR